jgi:hypothetical protein
MKYDGYTSKMKFKDIPAATSTECSLKETKKSNLDPKRHQYLRTLIINSG